MALVTKSKVKDFLYYGLAAAFGYVVLVAPVAYAFNLIRSRLPGASA